jgi:hypothetical protein
MCYWMGCCIVVRRIDDAGSGYCYGKVCCTVAGGAYLNGGCMYTVQRNAHGNMIVCKGNVVRKTYRIVFSGSYQACLYFKVNDKFEY